MNKSKSNVFHVSGKRKSAIARATIKPGRGLITVNGAPLDNFLTEFYNLRIREPLLLAGDVANKVNISVKVSGGGIAGQAEAVRLTIARALYQFTNDEELKDTFVNYDRQLLIADIRRKETRKPNRSKARAKRQKSYR
ncbi:MAG: 30S ribosomal protein S9 [Nitrospiraceae bacterium]|nr:30S ribosomal protein S9 [Nitrospiraceae bacterium]